MSLVVQKFGGTSLGTAERLSEVTNIVKKSSDSNDVIVVVSAVSSKSKAEGTTSRLIEAGDRACRGDDISELLETIEENHCKLAKKSITTPEILEQTLAYLQQELKQLKQFLKAIDVIKEVSSRSYDLIIGTGERLSAILLTGILQESGCDAVYTNISEVIPDGTDPTERVFYTDLRKWISKELPKRNGSIPVVTGFFGFVPGGIIHHIGRGYSDLTASLIASALKAEALEIWKEVDGIFTADPRRVPTAKVLSEISPEEAAELTYFGSEVLHPFTMEQAIKAKVPVYIKNTCAPHKPGTVIRPNVYSKTTATAVTTKKDIAIVNVRSNRMLDSSGFLAKVFDIFRAHKIVIDLISTSEVSVSCSTDRAKALKPALEDLKQLGEVSILTHRAILSLVGKNMKYVPGTSARMFKTLASDGINIEMITQGASEINISCVIKQEDADTALNTVHKEFLSS